jgi:hypothetical protein
MMRKLLVILPASIALSIAGGFAQTPIEASKPQAPSCVIVKRHVHKLGENMSRVHPHRPFDYVEGDYPQGFKWRSELSDGDVRELQQKGSKLVIMRADYEIADLEDARKQCQTNLGK